MDPGTLIELLMLGVLVAGSAMAGGRVFRSRDGQGADPQTTRLLMAAYVLALQLGDSVVRAGHLLLVASATPQGAAALHRRGLSLSRLSSALPPPLEADPEEATGKLSWSSELEEAFLEARQQAFSTGKPHFDLLTLLEALLQSPTPIAQIMREANVRFTEDDEPGEGRFIYLWNDARTPMEFVSETLTEVFEYGEAASLAAMLTTHYTGASALGPFERSQAESLIDAATERVYTGGHGTCLTLERPDLSSWIQTPNGPLPSR